MARDGEERLTNWLPSSWQSGEGWPLRGGRPGLVAAAGVACTQGWGCSPPPTERERPKGAGSGGPKWAKDPKALPGQPGSRGPGGQNAKQGDWVLSPGTRTTAPRAVGVRASSPGGGFTQSHPFAVTLSLRSLPSCDPTRRSFLCPDPLPGRGTLSVHAACAPLSPAAHVPQAQDAGATDGI